MHHRITWLLMLALILALSLACALAEDEPPSFLAQYDDWYEADGWFAVCLDELSDEWKEDSRTNFTDGSGETWYYPSPAHEADAHWALLDGEGNLLVDHLTWVHASHTDDDYYIAPYHGFYEDDPLARVCVNQKYGYVNRQGALVIDAVYDVAIEYAYTSYDLYDVGISTDEGTKWGVADETGELIPPEYDHIDPLGYHSWGSTTDVFCGWFAAEKNGKWGLINPEYKPVCDFVWDSIKWDAHPPLFPVERDGKWGYIDERGDLVIEPRYYRAGSFTAGRAAVKMEEDGLWGYIDEQGDYVIEPRFYQAGEFTQAGYAVTQVEPGYFHYVVIDVDGNVRMETDVPGVSLTVSDDGVVTKYDYYDGGSVTYYDLSSGEAKPVTELSSSLDLSQYMPFTGAKVAALDETAELDFTGLDAEELPRLDGATALLPVYAALVQAAYPVEVRYEDVETADDPIITCTKTIRAYERLIAGEADVIFVAQPSDEEKRMAEAAGVEFDMVPFGREAFVFVVNAQNPIQGLTLDEIRAIYAGQITDWGELGAPELGAIVPYQRPKNSGSQTALEALMGDTPLMEAPQQVVTEDMESILERVEYRNLPNAIGYSFRFFCTEMMRSEVKLLSVDGVAPTPEHIRDGSYPLTSTLYAIRLKGNDDPHVQQLLDWLTGAQGQALVEKSGYVSG